MINLETLYKRTTTGAIQEWTVYYGDGVVMAISGQVGGKLITHTQNIKGKNIGKSNETSPLAQAEFDAKSDWKRKMDGGYKSLEDLGLTVATKELLDNALPQYNTDASGNIKPMLAHEVKEGFSNVKLPCFIQPKLDGVRALLIMNEEGELEFLSRSGKQYTTLRHIINSVPDELKAVWITLDGEIYSDDLTFQEIVQAVKKQYPNSLKLKYRVYDVVTEDKQVQRLDTLNILISFLDSTLIQGVQTIQVIQHELIQSYHDAWVKAGYEGAMIRHRDGLYQQGQRSRSLLKFKEFNESEFDFIKFEFGQRNEDLIAVCESDKGLFKAKLKGSMELKTKLYDTYSLITGAKLTVKHFGFTDDGLPRFPIGKAFRDY